MAKVCKISGKTFRYGNKVSHANNKSRKRWDINLHTKRLFDPTTQKWVRIRLSSRALRTIDKIGFKAAMERNK